MKVSELVKNLLKKAGITHDAEIGEELADDVATQLDNSLLTIAAATNNHPAVKRVYFAQAYNGLDNELEQLQDEFGFDEGTRAALKGETSSTKRAVAIARKIKELESAKAGTGDQTKVAMQKQIEDLHKQLKAEQDALKNTKADHEKQLKQLQIRSKLDSLISSYSTVYDELPVEAKNAAINALIDKALQDNDAEFTLGENGTFAIQKRDGTNLFGDNHTQQTPQSFLDKTVSNILKQTETNPPAGGSGNGNIKPPAQSVKGGSGASNGNSALAAAVANSRQAYEQATKVAQ